MNLSPVTYDLSPETKIMSYAVMTACWNSGKTIRRSIDSVLSQNPPPSQYIFVDGGSQDCTLEIIEEAKREAAEKDLNTEFKVIHQTGKTGISGAWNLGLPEITADIVFILNSDDWYEPGVTETVIAKFADSPKAEIVLGDIIFHHEDGHKSRQKPRSFLLFPFLMPIMHPACFVKRSVYDRLGGFDLDYPVSMDYEFCYRALRDGVKFARIDRVCTHMLLGGNANSRRAEARRETRDAARKYCRIPSLPWLSYYLRYLLKR